MPPQLTIHIGFHRTGSTAVQRHLLSHREHLREHGVLYPDAGRPSARGDAPYGQHALAWALRRGETIFGDSPWTRLREEIEREKPNQVVISSEVFDALDAPALEHFAAWVASYDPSPHVIAYVRNVRAFLTSAYKGQLARGRTTLDVRTFWEHHLDRCDYADRLARWRRALPEAKLTVRPYDHVVRTGSLLDDFARHVAFGALLPSDSASERHRPNRSISDAAAQTAYRLGRIADRHPGTCGTVARRLRAWTVGVDVRYPRMRRLLGACIHTPLATADDLTWLRTETGDMRKRFAELYLSGDERALYEF